MHRMRIRRLAADEWARLREVRLRALADAPTAFGSTLAQERARPEEFWRERALRGSLGIESVNFVADDGGERLRGLTTGVHESPTHEHVHLYAMWVDPLARRSGVGRALVDAVCEWARERGAKRVRLGVTVTNEAAIRLYESCGFVATGRTEPLPHTPSLLEHEMERVL